jgi:hypothetical protein
LAPLGVGAFILSFVKLPEKSNEVYTSEQ